MIKFLLFIMKFYQYILALLRLHFINVASQEKVIIKYETLTKKHD